MRKLTNIGLIFLLFSCEIYAQNFYPDLSVPTSRFGESVTINNNWMAVGAPMDDENGVESGAVYLYKKVNDEWIHFTKVLGEENSMSQFGGMVVLNGDLLYISAVNKNANNLIVGAVYVYKFNGTTWVFEKEIQPENLSDGAKFGQFISISNGTVMISAPEQVVQMSVSGVVYAFDETNNWQEEFQLSSNTPLDVEQFGKFIHVDDTWLTISAFRDLAGYKVGQVNIYRNDSLGWNLIQQEEGNLFDKKYLGRSVDVLGDLMVIGATYSITPNDEIDSGEVSIYRYDSNVNLWNLDNVIHSPIELGYFGWTTKLIANKLYIGSRFDLASFGYPRGNLYIYFDEGNGYEFQYRIFDPYNHENQDFTQSVSFIDDFILIGAPGTEIGEIQYGMVSLHQQKYKLIINVTGLNNPSEDLLVKETLQNNGAYIPFDMTFSFGYLHTFQDSFQLAIMELPKDPNHECTIDNEYGSFWDPVNILVNIECTDVDTIFSNTF
ncbi:MAG: FG-GAP repeat protein [Xanthomonadales bacterium]|nr:FG-GAP repeat protein [Xanthomonadales bacterium]